MMFVYRSDQKYIHHGVKTKTLYQNFWKFFSKFYLSDNDVNSQKIVLHFEKDPSLNFCRSLFMVETRGIIESKDFTTSAIFRHMVHSRFVSFSS